MSNRPSPIEYTIASGARVGTAININQSQGHTGNAVVGVILPAASDNVTFNIQADYGDGTLRNVSDAAGNAETITFGANLQIWLAPAITAGAQLIALYGNTGNETADRTFQILVRGVQ